MPSTEMEIVGNTFSSTDILFAILLFSVQSILVYNQYKVIRHTYNALEINMLATVSSSWCYVSLYLKFQML